MQMEADGKTPRRNSGAWGTRQPNGKRDTLAVAIHWQAGNIATRGGGGFGRELGTLPTGCRGIGRTFPNVRLVLDLVKFLRGGNRGVAWANSFAR